VAATVSPGSAPPILRRGRTTHAGNDVCVGTVTVKTMDYTPSHGQLDSERVAAGSRSMEQRAQPEGADPG
jgi:hypothetical protein